MVPESLDDSSSPAGLCAFPRPTYPQALSAIAHSIDVLQQIHHLQQGVMLFPEGELYKHPPTRICMHCIVLQSPMRADP
jgi:hypothetical protein